MALGSLLDAGADLDSVRGILGRLPLVGWSLEVEAVLRAGLACTRAVVSVREDNVVRTHAHIVGIIEEARLPARVRDRALAVFGTLAEVEGALHGRPAAQVHFHEVGGHDAIVDIVGFCAALEVLGVDEVCASSVTTGTGVVRTAHGVFPNPSPAVVALLQGVPVEGRGMNVELTTPTGAALLAAMSVGFGPLPAMQLEVSGYGAGSRELDGWPNVVQVVLGTRPAGPAVPGGAGPAVAGGAGPAVAGGAAGQPLVVLEANVDDVTGEVLAHSVGALLASGAADAWLTPVLMKKGRPGHVLSVLADPALAESLAEVMRAETGTLGVRSHEVARWSASRSIEEVQVEGMLVRVKVSPGRVKAEQEDAARVARLRGLPLREVTARAEAAWRAPDSGKPAPDAS
jgi:uncharacterized protein (TIGR00299 family) protein